MYAKYCIPSRSAEASIKKKDWARRLAEEEKTELLIEIARAYYEQDHDQGEIAQSLGISRSQVSRYLSQAKELNIVQDINILSVAGKKYLEFTEF